jgi:hypothetical protein
MIEGDNTQIVLGHNGSYVAGANVSVAAGGNVSIVPGYNFEGYFGGKQEVGVYRVVADGKLTKVWGEEDEVGSVHNELNAVSQKVFGKTAKAVADEMVTQAAFSQIAGNSSVVRAQDTITIAERIASCASQISTIGNAVNAVGTAVQQIVDSTVMAGAATEMVSVKQTVADAHSVVVAALTIV